MFILVFLVDAAFAVIRSDQLTFAGVVLTQLNENNVPLFIVNGSCSSALNGGMLACDPNGYIVTIYATAKGLKGNFGQVDFSPFPQLQYITFVDNQLYGTIPASLSSVSQLKVLQIQNNRLTGSLRPLLTQAPFTNISTCIVISTTKLEYNCFSDAFGPDLGKCNLLTSSSCPFPATTTTTTTVQTTPFPPTWTVIETTTTTPKPTWPTFVHNTSVTTNQVINSPSALPVATSIVDFLESTTDSSVQNQPSDNTIAIAAACVAAVALITVVVAILIAHRRWRVRHNELELAPPPSPSSISQPIDLNQIMFNDNNQAAPALYDSVEIPDVDSSNGDDSLASTPKRKTNQYDDARAVRRPQNDYIQPHEKFS